MNGPLWVDLETQQTHLTFSLQKNEFWVSNATLTGIPNRDHSQIGDFLWWVRASLRAVDRKKLKSKAQNCRSWSMMGGNTNHDREPRRNPRRAANCSATQPVLFRHQAGKPRPVEHYAKPP